MLRIKLQETVSEKMLGEVEHTFNLSTQDGEAGGSLSSRTARAPQTVWELWWESHVQHGNCCLFGLRHVDK